jgi:hypothetical protein
MLGKARKGITILPTVLYIYILCCMIILILLNPFVFLIHCGLYLNNILPVSSACRLWAHLTMTYVFTFWTFYILYKEYKVVATMRLNFLASEERRPDQFTVRSPLVSCIYFILIKISNTNSLINYSVFDDMYIIILTCRFWCEMCPQIQMNQSVSMFSIFFL